MDEVELGPPRVVYLILVGGVKPVGEVGFFDNDDGTAQLDWEVEEPYRERGLGSVAVGQMIQQLDAMGRFTSYEVLIRPGNLASLRLASGQGFEVYLITEENIYMRRRAGSESGVGQGQGH